MITCKELILKEEDGEIRTFYDLQTWRFFFLVFSYSSWLCVLSPDFVSFSRIIITDDAEYMCLHAESRTGISRVSLMSRSREKTEGGGRWGRQSG